MSSIVDPVYQTDSFTDPFSQTNTDVSTLYLTSDTRRVLQDDLECCHRLPSYAHLRPNDWHVRYYFKIDTSAVSDPESHLREVSEAVLTDEYALPRSESLSDFMNWVEVKKQDSVWEVMLAWEPMDD